MDGDQSRLDMFKLDLSKSGSGQHPVPWFNASFGGVDIWPVWSTWCDDGSMFGMVQLQETPYVSSYALFNFAYGQFSWMANFTANQLPTGQIVDATCNYPLDPGNIYLTTFDDHGTLQMWGLEQKFPRAWWQPTQSVALDKSQYLPGSRLSVSFAYLDRTDLKWLVWSRRTTLNFGQGGHLLPPLNKRVVLSFQLTTLSAKTLKPTGKSFIRHVDVGAFWTQAQDPWWLTDTANLVTFGANMYTLYPYMQSTDPASGASSVFSNLTRVDPAAATAEGQFQPLATFRASPETTLKQMPMGSSKMLMMCCGHILNGTPLEFFSLVDVSQKTFTTVAQVEADAEQNNIFFIGPIYNSL